MMAKKKKYISAAQLEVYRREYAALRAASLPKNNKAFDKTVRRYLRVHGLKFTPENWIKMARLACPDRLKWLYKVIRKRSLAPNYKIFDKAVADLLQDWGITGPSVPPTDWVLAAREVEFSCPACNGTGEYENLGVCYACQGKGAQNDSDVRRNWHYKQKYQEGN